MLHYSPKYMMAVDIDLYNIMYYVMVVFYWSYVMNYAHVL